MSAENRIVAYVFSHVPKSFESKDEPGKHPWINRQCKLIEHFAKRNGLQIEKFFVHATTYRGKSFAEFSQFDLAVARGLAHSHPIVIGDLRELLRRTKASLITRAFTKLDQVPATVIDASSGQKWRDIPDSDKQSMMLEAVRANHARSQIIRAGQGLKWDERRAPPKSNQLLGAKANSIGAQNRAAALAPFVTSIEGTLPPGTKLSASMLAHELNKAGVPATRSSIWSVNAAKNVLARLRR